MGLWSGYSGGDGFWSGYKTAPPPEPPKKSLTQKGIDLLGQAGNAVKNYVDQDKKGVGIGDIVSLPGRATVDAGKMIVKGVVDPAKKLGETISYAADERIWRSMRDKGQISNDVYLQLTNEQGNKAGINIQDKDGTLLRKIGANVGENVLNIATAGGAGAVAKQGVKLGAKEIAKQTLKAGAKGAAAGATYGVLGTAQGDDPTAGDYLKSAAAGAALGAGAGAGLHLAGAGAGAAGRKVANAVTNEFDKKVGAPGKINLMNTEINKGAASEALKIKEAAGSTKGLPAGETTQLALPAKAGGKTAGEGFTMSDSVDQSAVAAQKEMTKLQTRITRAQQGKNNYPAEQLKKDMVRLNELKNGQADILADYKPAPAKPGNVFAEAQSKPNSDLVNIEQPNVNQSTKTVDIQAEPNTPSSAEIAAKRSKVDLAMGVKPEGDLGFGDRKAFALTRATRAIENYANGLAEKGLSSNSKAVRGVAKGLQMLAGEAGKSEEQIARAKQYRGGVGSATRVARDVQEHTYSLLGTDKKQVKGSLERVHAVLDPEGAKGAVDYSELTPKEQEATDFLRNVSDYMNDLNYHNGFIGDEQWKAGQGGRYIARAYEEFEYPKEVKDFLKQSRNLKFDDSPYKARGVLTDEMKNDMIRDPAYLMAKRLQQTEFNNEVKQMGDWLAGSKLVSQTERPGYIKVGDSKLYGELAGKYVRKDAMEDMVGFFSENKAIQGMYDLLNWYDRNPIRQARKKLLTVWNPGTRVGNRASNYAFAFFNGINPVSFHNSMTWAKKAIKSNDPLYRRMQQMGLVGNDVSKVELQTRLQEIQKLTDDPKILSKAKNMLGKIDEIVTDTYGGLDDRAKLAAMKVYRDRGYSLEESARRVHRGFQDYGSVGLLYNLGAKSPVLGNAFIRFSADALRIGKNNIVDHPIRSAATVAGWVAFTDMMSKLSGETPEDRKTREDRAGAGKIPFTDISTEVQTPYGAFDFARLVGLTLRNELGGASNLNQLSPFQSPMTTDKQTGEAKVNAQAFANDPLVGPVVSLMSDTDFRGKSIKDPSQKAGQPSTLSSSEDTGNQVKFGIRSYTPPVVNTALDLKDAAQGKENFYGGKKSVPEVAASALGGKLTEYGPKKAQDSRDAAAAANLKKLEPVDQKIQILKNQLHFKEITQEEYDRRVAEAANEKNKIIMQAKSAGTLSDKMNNKVTLAEKDAKNLPLSIFEAGEQFKNMTGSVLPYMQVLRASGDKSYNSFFASHPELDPTSDQFQGFGRTLNKNKDYAETSAGLQKAREAGMTLQYMQALRLSDPAAYKNFFADHPELDPNSDQFQGFKSSKKSSFNNPASRAKANLKRSIKTKVTTKIGLKTRSKIKVAGRKKSKSTVSIKV